MLTVDLVPARRRGGKLHVPGLSADKKRSALAIAEHYISVTMGGIGRSRREVDTLCAALHVAPRDRKLSDGLHKLVLDRCTFDVGTDIDPSALRRELFTLAADHRRRASREQPFDPSAVQAAAAKKLGLDPRGLEQLLYADLKDAHTLSAFESISAPELVARYEQALNQGVLLKAVSVEVVVSASSPAFYRELFHKLKFLQLLYTIHPHDDGYRIHIDGPFSLFSSSTRYGLKLALLLPTLEMCGRYKLRARVVWGKEREKLEFNLEGRRKAEGRQPGSDREPVLPDELASFASRFNALENGWQAEASTTILDLPGEGLCIPDLLFTHRETQSTVYFEVMGFWSRAAVWRRVELVEAGLPYRIIFAVSQRLRVSAEVLSEELPGSLYVYKGKINAAAVTELLARHLEEPPQP